MFNQIIKDIKNFYNFFKINKKKIRIFFIENEFISKHMSYYIRKNKDKKKTLILIYGEFCLPNSLNQFDKIVIKKSFFLALIFIFLKIKYCYSSTPDLGYNIFFKSINSENKYLYLHHSPFGFTKIYNKKAFFNYDYVHVLNKSHIKEIHEINSKLKTNIKFFKCSYFTSKIEYKKNNSKFDVLIAPTWNTDFYEKKVILKLIYELLANRLSFVIKPHMMSKKYDANYAQNSKFFQKYCLSEDLKFDEFKYLITDWSGLYFEYAFVSKKKSILINTKQKIINKDDKFYQVTPEENISRETFGFVFDKNDVKEIATFIKNNYNPKECEKLKMYLKNNFFI